MVIKERWTCYVSSRQSYIDRHANHLNDIISVQAHPAHRYSSTRSTKTFYCNRKFSRRTPTALDGNGGVSLNLANSFERADY